MNVPTQRLFLLGAALWLGCSAAAYACGSMGLDDIRTRNILSAAVLVPMLLLIPVELWFLRILGGLGPGFVKAYLACLPAKAAGLGFVAMGVQQKVVEGVVSAELAYSAGHLLLASLVLGLGFKLRGRRLVLCALAISTIIPWLYSLGFWQIARLA